MNPPPRINLFPDRNGCICRVGKAVSQIPLDLLGWIKLLEFGKAGFYERMVMMIDEAAKRIADLLNKHGEDSARTGCADFPNIDQVALMYRAREIAGGNTPRALFQNMKRKERGSYG